MTRHVPFAAVICLATAMAAGPVIIEPQDFASQLQAKGPRPDVFYVGFAVLYRKHIPGAVFAGPASRAEGLAAFKAAVEKIPRNHEVVIYCGCCPWEMCPNMKPALDLMKELGFKRVKALRIETSFAKDWLDHSYPVEERPASK